MNKKGYLIAIIIVPLLLSLAACAHDGVAGKYECPVQGFPSFYLDLNSDGTFWLQKPSREQTTGTWQRKGNEIYLSSPDLNWMMFPAKLRIEGDMLIAVRPENPIPFNRIGDVSSDGVGNLWPLFWIVISIGILALGLFIVNMFIKIPLPIPRPHLGPSVDKREMAPHRPPFKSEQRAAEAKTPTDVKPGKPGLAGSRVETPVETGPLAKPEVQSKPVDIGPSLAQPAQPPVEIRPPVSSGQQTPSIDVQPAAPVIIPAPIPIEPSTKPAPPTAKAKLVVTQTGRVGQEFSITKESVDIGRWDPDGGFFPEIDLTQDDPGSYVSRRHARISFKDGQYYIEDMGSANGTFVNKGPRLVAGVQQELKSGDEIVVGRTFLKFVI